MGTSRPKGKATVSRATGVRRGVLVAALVAVPMMVTAPTAYADHSVLELVTTSATAGNAAVPAVAVYSSDDGSRVFFETTEPMVTTGSPAAPGRTRSAPEAGTTGSSGAVRPTSLDAGKGDDVVTGGRGPRQAVGGPGDDRLLGADGRADVLNCGPGHDEYTADRSDKIIGCEVRLRG